MPLSSQRAPADASESAPYVLRRGERLGNYQLLAPVGAGGMAYVWAAARTGDYGFRRLFAIKVMRDEIAFEPSFRRMFLEEARLAARIRHTNVVEVLDLGEHAGMVYHVMPLIEGGSLAGLLRSVRSAKQRVSPEIALRIVVDVLRGLHAAHEMRAENGALLGIVHRDVSPHNILVGVDGIAKIADFGVAKAIGDGLDETQSGDVKGKLAYMSPEQFQKRPIDRRSDLFTVGIVLWELLTGDRMTPPPATLAIAKEPIVDPRTRDASVPPALAEIAMRALAREPSERFATADEMADALEAAARACDLALSAKDLGAWAAALARGDLAKRHEEVAEAASTIGESEVERARAARGKKRIAIATATAIAMAFGLAAASSRRPRVSVATSPAETTAASITPAAAASSVQDEPIAPIAHSATAPESASGAHPAATTKPHRGHELPPRRPKFDNPYQR